MIECNIIHQAFRAGEQRLLQLGSSCIYPKDAQQPLSEESLLTGKLESTTDPNAKAKIVGSSLFQVGSLRSSLPAMR
jgi:GDP-L-fucose synthase